MLLLPALAVALSARAADAPAGVPGVRAAVDVTVMDLDVVATGKDGRNVPDLTRAEISVTVDGKPLPLDYFVRVEAGQLHGPDLATASPDFILETTAAGADRYVPRQFLVFFDDEHLLPSDRKRVFEGLRDFVTRLSPSDSMAILSYNISTHVITPFTSSKETLLDGLSRLEKLASTRALLGVAVPPGRESRASSASFVPRRHHPELQRADQEPREGHARRAQARVRGPRGALRQARGALGLERDRASAGADVRGGPRLDAPEPVRVFGHRGVPSRRRRGEPVRHHRPRARRARSRDRHGRLRVERARRVRVLSRRESPRGARGPRRAKRAESSSRTATRSAAPSSASIRSRRATTRSGSRSRPSTRRRPTTTCGSRRRARA